MECCLYWNQSDFCWDEYTPALCMKKISANHRKCSTGSLQQQHWKCPVSTTASKRSKNATTQMCLPAHLRVLIWRKLLFKICELWIKPSDSLWIPSNQFQDTLKYVCGKLLIMPAMADVPKPNGLLVHIQLQFTSNEHFKVLIFIFLFIPIFTFHFLKSM